MAADLEKVSEAKGAVDEAKGAVLQEVSATVEQIQSAIKQRKTQLAPQIQRLREIREQYQVCVMEMLAADTARCNTLLHSIKRALTSTSSLCSLQCTSQQQKHTRCCSLILITNNFATDKLYPC